MRRLTLTILIFFLTASFSYAFGIVEEARKLIKEKKYKEAIKLLKDRDDTVSITLLAKAYKQEEKYEEAATAMLKGWEVTKNKDFLYNASIYYILADKPIKSLTYFKIYSHIVSESDNVLMGDLYYRAGVPLKAAEYYMKELKINPCVSIYERISSAYISAYKNDKAKEILIEGTKETKAQKLFKLLGAIFYEEKNFKEALNVFEEGIIQKKDGELLMFKAYTALALNRVDIAKVSFKEAMLFPDKKKEAEKYLKHFCQKETFKDEI